MIEHAFRQWLAGTDTVILVCWDLGHIWDSQIYDSIERIAHGAHMLTGYCQREENGVSCGVKRSRYLTSTWSPDAGKNSYTYPKGYSPRGMMREGFFMDALHRSEIRREIARRKKEDRKNAKKEGESGNA